MTEFGLFESMPELNTRGVMGRVFVSPVNSAELKPRRIGSIFMCCNNRFFLTPESLERHLASGECTKSSNSSSSSSSSHSNHDASSSSGRSSPGSGFSNESGSVKSDSDPGMLEVDPFSLEDLNMVQSSLRGNNADMRATATASPSASPGNLKWIQAGRKRNVLHELGKEGKPTDGDQDNLLETSSSTPVEDVEVQFIIKTGMGGTTTYSCRECTYTTQRLRDLKPHLEYRHGLVKKSASVPPPTPSHSKVRISVNEGTAKNLTTVIQENIGTPPASDSKSAWHHCDRCEYKTLYRNNLGVHKKTAHYSGPGGFACDFCTCMYVSQGGLTSHINKLHKTATSTPSKLTPRQIEEQEEKVPVIVNQTSLRTPSEVMTGSQNLSVKKGNESEAVSLSCKLCNWYTCGSKYSLKNHRQIAHVFNGNYRCPHCPCKYKMGSQLQLHILKIHGKLLGAEVKAKASHGLPTFTASWVNETSTEFHAEEKKSNGEEIRCEPCGRNFVSLYLLQVHEANYHVKDGGVPCPVEGCKCVCRNKRSLHNHKHTWHKSNLTPTSTTISEGPLNEPVPFKLDESLDTDFDMSQDDSEHDNDMSGADGSLKCDLCGLIAKDIGELTNHLKDSHVICGVECDCGCSFASATALTNHKKNECPKSPKPGTTPKTVPTITTPSKGESTSEIALPLEKCLTCARTFTTRIAYRKHKRLGRCGTPASADGKDTLGVSDDDEDDDENRKDGVTEAKDAVLETKVTCSYCGKTLKNMQGLAKHMRMMHNTSDSKPINPEDFKRCEICNYNTVNYLNYQSHKKSNHVAEGVHCPYCPCSFKSLGGVMAHFQMTHKSVKLKIQDLEKKCDLCDYVTYRQSNLERHLRAGHVEKEKKEVAKEKKILKCDKCDYIANCSSTFTRHCSANHVEGGFQCEWCNNSFKTKPGLRAHISLIHPSEEFQEEKMVFSCELCDFNTHAPAHLEDHKSRNHVENGLKCQFCPNTFASENGLRGHVYNMHTKLTREDYEYCDICKYRTGSHKNFKQHKSSCHVKDGIQCPDCPCSLKNVYGLQQHMRMLHKKQIDKADYLIKCDLCDFGASDQSSLKQHKKITHSAVATPVKNPSEVIKCPLCEVVISSSSTIEDHFSRAHVECGHACSDCNCSFATEIGLIRHARVRHRKKLAKTKKKLDPNVYNIVCSVCTFRTRSLVGLNQHTFKIHGFSTPIMTFPKSTAPPKPHKRRVCDLCKMSTSGTLAAHIKRYHVENGFKCSHCCCSFETFHSRSRHMVKAHRIVPSKKCTICQLTFLGTIKQHMKLCHVENGLKCQFCSCSFETEPGRATHVRRRHNASMPKQQMTCDLCGFSTFGKMELHKERCHVKDGVKCEYCCCSFVSEKGRSRHMMIRHNVSSTMTCNLCDFKINNMAQHLEKCHVQDGIKCKYCCCSFMSEQGCFAHMKFRHKISSDEAKTCPKCGIVPVVSLRMHLEHSHVENGYPCSHCSCSFETERIKITHLQRYHDVQPAAKKCSICSMTIVGSTEKHMRRNHVANGYQCSHCNCSFETERTKVNHLQRCHNVQPTARKCSICNMIVTTTLQHHMNRLHVKNGYPCELCNVSLKSEQGRFLHMNKRHKEVAQEISKSRCTCDICGVPVKGSLEDHMLRNHSSTNKFKCQHCTNRFATPIGRRHHMFKRHKHLISTKPAELKPKEPGKGQIVLPKETCQLCGMTIFGKNYMKDHLKRNHVENGVPCPHCPCKFSSELGRSIHENSIHPQYVKNHDSLQEVVVDENASFEHDGELPSTSRQVQQSNTEYPTTPKRSNPKTSIRNKIASPYLPKDKLTCPHCGYLATFASHFNMHLQKSHVKNSPYPCRLCACSFATQHELDRHSKVLHPEPVSIE